MTKKMLIVEDEETILTLLSTIFSFSEEYKITLARNAEEALNIIRKDKQDIIILDIQLPKMDGYELCKLVKSDTAMSQTKVLMLTGLAQDYNIQKGLEVGADACMTKPFSASAIVEKVKELLKSK
jgi:two-component system alkaline phosphatase synthesis response regulator PhoP